MLDAIREELIRGRGFVLIRGLPIGRYSVRQRAIAYWGIGTWLGRAVSQNAMGHLLGHVIDLGRSNDDYQARTYQTRDRQFFHADSCDIVGLLCVRKAKKGGLSAIVSSVTLYNEMLARSPELTAELFRPIHFDRRGEVPEGRSPWYEKPVFNWYEGRLSTHYVRRYIQSIRRLHEVPPLTDRQIAAFDLLDEIAEDPGVQLRMDFEPGDMQFLHNPQILHDRTAYEDADDPAERRHLLRLWLCPPDGRPLPPAYAGRWGSNAIGNRGGIVVKGAIAPRAARALRDARTASGSANRPVPTQKQAPGKALRASVGYGTKTDRKRDAGEPNRDDFDGRRDRRPARPGTRAGEARRGGAGAEVGRRRRLRRPHRRARRDLHRDEPGISGGEPSVR